jgi:bifunctional non-homologous end joining protein LigD
MLATPARELPHRAGWAYEMKWDGVRAVARVRGGALRLVSRNGNDVTPAYPELQGLAAVLAPHDAVLDGEIVAFDELGRASFEVLQSRMHVRDERAVARLVTETPVVYMLFDLLELDDESFVRLPYRERRARLEALALSGPHWQTPPAAEDDPDAALEASRRLGFEGVVATRLDAPYESGRHSTNWVKVKHQLRQEFVVGGYEPGAGGREGTIGSLLLGVHDDTGPLRYAGKVGTGFTVAELERLRAVMAPLETPTSPFAGGGTPRTARFVEPRLVVEVRFTEWTTAGRVRQAAYLGQRDDKDPGDVVRESRGV